MTLLMVKNQGGLRLPVQAGRQRSMGMLFPSSLPTGREECTGLWDPSAAAGKGREFCQGLGGWWRWQWCCISCDTLLKRAHLSFLQRFCSQVTSSQVHLLLGFLASRKKRKLLQTIPISRLDLKWLAEGGEENSLISWSFREGWFSQIFS